MNRNVNFPFIQQWLANRICEAAQAGADNANDGMGTFEARFQEKFVETFGTEPDFPEDQGYIKLEEFGVNTDAEARTGSDLCITWISPPADRLEDNKAFKLYLQLKLKYNSYDHYHGSINYGKFGTARSKKTHESWSKTPYFNYEYQSERHGEYFGKYQLVQMDAHMKMPPQNENPKELVGDKVIEIHKGTLLARAGFLLIDTPGADGLSQYVRLLPVEGLRKVTKASSFYHRITEDDVKSFTSVDIDESIKHHSFVIIPRAEGPLSAFLSQCLSEEHYKLDEAPYM